jgi:hypothetical protein
MHPRFADLSEDEMGEILNETKNNLKEMAAVSDVVLQCGV